MLHVYFDFIVTCPNMVVFTIKDTNIKLKCNLVSEIYILYPLFCLLHSFCYRRCLSLCYKRAWPTEYKQVVFSIWSPRCRFAISRYSFNLKVHVQCFKKRTKLHNQTVLRWERFFAAIQWQMLSTILFHTRATEHTLDANHNLI